MEHKYNKYMDLVHNAFDVHTTPRLVKRIILILVDLCIIPFAFWAAFALRFGEWVPHTVDFWWIVIAAPLVSIPIFYAFGLYRSMLRYMGIQVGWALVKGMATSTLILTALVLFTQTQGFPRSVFIIYFSFGVLLMGGSRVLMRAYLMSVVRVHKPKDAMIIYGAGSAGVQLATALVNANDSKVVAFIDDDQAIQGNLIHGIKVFSKDKLQILIEKYSVRQILLAMPSTRKSARRRLLQSLDKFAVRVRTVPGMEDLVSGKSSVEEIQDVDVLDLLGRDSVPPDVSLLKACIENKVVMVTGAGGSIGSELCRQIIKSNPDTLVLLEQSEYALYQIEKNLLARLDEHESNIKLISVLGSVQNKFRLSQTIKACKVNTIYHAAAYKHVPLVEHNIIEGIRNNIFGTSYAAEAALENNVETFILISTDKAVRPTNLMGASKRFAELILQAYSRIDKINTRFCMVRFGNVLGSSGSVVPLFREQILSGGPVTVTHPDIIRYFMTIPEAAQLVIQASSLGHGGDVFVLDMGEPVKILDLAYRMIRLMGLEVSDEQNSEADIEIKFTGLRPGEKLYEELLIGNNVVQTPHPRIQRAEEDSVSLEEIKDYMVRLDKACSHYNCELIVNLMTQVVLEYTPSKEIMDTLWFNHEHELEQAQLRPRNDKVVKLKP
ncbi:Nucleoside-diphosphate sugar epimerase/dehydratase [hydrothermal vent metagenome]|uniref:Nucleoside-diphosphate sugar epimerase/dehydratase n=1 Tax=hydrothermal vent metagenome TaxID=652676 RepID=A0A3B1AP37_9ZZZZ